MIIFVLVQNMWFFSWTHNKYSEICIFFTFLRPSCSSFPSLKPAAPICNNQYAFFPEDFSWAQFHSSTVATNITARRTMLASRTITQKSSVLFYFSTELIVSYQSVFFIYPYFPILMSHFYRRISLFHLIRLKISSNKNESVLRIVETEMQCKNWGNWKSC